MAYKYTILKLITDQTRNLSKVVKIFVFSVALSIFT